MDKTKTFIFPNEPMQGQHRVRPAIDSDRCVGEPYGTHEADIETRLLLDAIFLTCDGLYNFIIPCQDVGAVREEYKAAFNYLENKGYKIAFATSHYIRKDATRGALQIKELQK